RAAGLRKDVTLLAPAECERLAVQADGAVLSLRDGRELHGALIAGADGANSFVREKASIAASTSAYGQDAVVANFECEKPHDNLAYQWFQRGPVLALLPLPGRRVSMVWSLGQAEAQRVMRLKEADLCREVEQAAAGLLGALKLVTPAKSYPLRRLAAARLVS